MNLVPHYAEVTPGTIGILTRDGTSCDELSEWLEVMIRQYPQIYLPKRMKGTQIAAQRNMVVQQAKGEWILFVDNDNVPPLDTLPRLLAHKVPIVGGVITERVPPFRICATKALEPSLRYELEELPPEGLLPVVAVGTGCMLIHQDVFERMEYPWFQVGQLDAQFLTEDTHFCLKASEVGCQTWLDCGVRVGHRTYGILYPSKDKQIWVRWPGPADIREPFGDHPVEFSRDTVDAP